MIEAIFIMVVLVTAYGTISSHREIAPSERQRAVNKWCDKASFANTHAGEQNKRGEKCDDSKKG